MKYIFVLIAALFSANAQAMCSANCEWTENLWCFNGSNLTDCTNNMLYNRPVSTSKQTWHEIGNDNNDLNRKCSAHCREGNIISTRDCAAIDTYCNNN